jgi:hypothetical protein
MLGEAWAAVLWDLDLSAAKCESRYVQWLMISLFIPLRRPLKDSFRGSESRVPFTFPIQKNSQRIQKKMAMEFHSNFVTPPMHSFSFNFEIGIDKKHLVIKIERAMTAHKPSARVRYTIANRVFELFRFAERRRYFRSPLIQ